MDCPVKEDFIWPHPPFYLEKIIAVCTSIVYGIKKIPYYIFVKYPTLYSSSLFMYNPYVNKELRTDGP